jgi:hypothetical protein
MAKKSQVNQSDIEWKTLHIFGYGETELVEDLPLDFANSFASGQMPTINSKKVATSTLIKAKALIDFVYGKKPVDSDAGVEFHSITILKNYRCRYIPKNVGEKNYEIEYNHIDISLIQDLVAEIQAL